MPGVFWSHPSSWWRFDTEAEAPWGMAASVLSHARRCTARERDRRQDGLWCVRNAAIKPCALAHRCAAAGLDSDAPAERGVSMPFHGAVDRLKWARPRMGSAGDRRSSRPWCRRRRCARRPRRPTRARHYAAGNSSNVTTTRISAGRSPQRAWHRRGSPCTLVNKSHMIR